MPRGVKNQPAAEQPQQLAAPAAPRRSPADLGRRLRPTKLHHVFHFDIAGDNKFREVAVVKMAKTADGTIQSVYYIDVGLCDQVDKGRMKTIVTSVHADKYELWDLLSQTTLNNGKNALDYFHQLVKVVHGPGAVTSSPASSLSLVRAESGNMVGSEFTDPASGAVDPTHN